MFSNLVDMWIKLLFVIFISFAGSAVTNDCLLCTMKIPESAKELGSADACSDLFGAACTDRKGKTKFKEQEERIDQKMKEQVLEARNKALKEMGYKDLTDAMTKRLKAAGLNLSEGADPQSIYDSRGNISAEVVYTDAKECKKEADAINNMDIPYNDPLQLASIRDNLILFRDKYNDVQLQFTHLDIPEFAEKHIGEKCNQVIHATTDFMKKLNPKAYEICSNFDSIKRQAVELFRKEGTPEYEALAKSFVRRYSIPPIVNEDRGESETLSDEIQKEIYAIRSSVYNICQSLNETMQSVAEGVVTSINTDTASSKVAIDHLINHYYTPERRGQLQPQFEVARGSISKFVDQFVSDPAKKQRIISEYGQLDYQWFDSPPANLYSDQDFSQFRVGANKTNVKVLDEDKLEFGSPYSFFLDPELFYFSSLNAFYNPSTITGAGKLSEKVNMLPGFFHLMDENPFAFFSTFGHEVAHKIGPELSRINGHNLAAEYKDLLACYRDNKSIKMERGQEDEVIADYVASEMMASEIMKMPENDRKAAVLAMVGDFCLFEQGEMKYHSLSCRGVHPQNTLRVSGIYGANPSIRKALGCTGESPNFKSCALDVSLLDLIEDPDKGGPYTPDDDIKIDGVFEDTTGSGG